MQLGELQNQIARFEARGVSIVALSVDEPEASLAIIERLGLTFDLGSDPAQTVVKAFGVQNPTTRELAIHAVYIVDADGTVFYRKVGRRRPVSAELIDAIDAFAGTYPRNDEQVQPRRRIAVAFPENDFQALLTVARIDGLPDTVDAAALARVESLLRAGRSDDATIAFKALAAASTAATRQDLYDTAAWLTRRLFFTGKPEALDAGTLLGNRLARIAQLEAELKAAGDADRRDELLHTLARARAGLEVTRAEISRNAAAWSLRFAKTTLRSYREVAGAAVAIRESAGNAAAQDSAAGT